jgi:hypothetical protein
MVRHLWAAALALATGACGMDCTTIGCNDALTLRFATPILGPLHVDAFSSDGEHRTYDCTNAAGCPDSEVALARYLPTTVTLTLTYQGRTSTSTVKPSYTESSPNGPSCGPTCRQGTVTVALP